MVPLASKKIGTRIISSGPFTVTVGHLAKAVFLLHIPKLCPFGRPCFVFLSSVWVWNIGWRWWCAEPYLKRTTHYDPMNMMWWSAAAAQSWPHPDKQRTHLALPGKALSILVCFAWWCQLPKCQCQGKAWWSIQHMMPVLPPCAYQHSSRHRNLHRSSTLGIVLHPWIIITSPGHLPFSL
jgi:hypothetical protein